METNISKKTSNQYNKEYDVISKEDTRPYKSNEIKVEIVSYSFR